MTVSTSSHLETAATHLPNSATGNRLSTQRQLITGRRVWAMLAARIGLAVSFQALFAAIHWVSGDPSPWRAAADWWLASLVLAEMVNLWLLARCARLEGIRLRDLYNAQIATWRGDLKWAVLALVVAAPLALIPGALLADALWADPQIAQDMLFRAVWVPAAWVLLLVFPVVHALTELPTYFGYVMPRLRVITGRSGLSLLLTASTLSVQHAFLPLLFNGPYLVWRALMFLPLAVWLGWVIRRRGSALPYVAAAHGLLDVSLPVFVLIASLSG